ncbi:phosphatase PAP2 family protein [Paenibacillus macerans]|uniref:phosphatase PAP2 family protein n=1 Tax=Paenibacillus macerans TaxID=44252 RepID=UPI002DC04FCF|nr:phosphatase PAP2 family protein [Paenibacillus macerans]
MFVQDNEIRHFDQVIPSWIQHWETPALTVFMKFFTTIGGSLPLILVIITAMAVLYTVLGHRGELVFLAGVMLGSTVLNWALKTLFHRARPVIHRIIEAEGYSFPSGHSMAAFSFYGALAFLIWRHVPASLGRSLMIVLSTLFILAIGISRIYLGVHYPSDVLGGYFVSGCWLTASILWYKKNVLDRTP